jgi:RimJ/RimL family protein N-acetyltransferase
MTDPRIPEPDEMSDQEFERWYGPWDPLSPPEISDLLRGFNGPWMIVGGHAIEAFTGVHRKHEDVDVAILRRDLSALRASLSDRYQAWSAGSGLLRPLNADHPELPAGAGQVWIREHAQAPWRADFILLTDRDGDWISNHDQSMTFAFDDSSWRDAAGIPFVRPEIALAHKARKLASRHDHDFGVTWPLLDDAARRWLQETVERLYPKHPWLNRMAAPDHPVTRDGARVRLREAVLADADIVDARAVNGQVLGEFNDFGARKPKPLAENLAHGKRMVGPERGVLLIVRIEDDAIIGEVSWHTVSYGPNEESRAFNVGIALVPDSRGQGFGTEAQRLLAEVLFELYDVERIEASTDVDNVAEQRSLEKAGFTREGILRRAQFRSGEHHDLVGFSIIRTEARGSSSDHRE